MRLKKIIFIIIIDLCLIIFQSYCVFGATSYIWSESKSGLIETVSDTETDLKLESGGAILIEQSSRKCTL